MPERGTSRMLNERKVAQMAAYFIHLEGGNMSILKLMKLLYLSERESLKEYCMPMTGDHAVSMDLGPVLSNTYNLANNTSIYSAEDGWNSWMAPREGNDICLKRSICTDDLDELSKADIKVLKNVWNEFGHLSPWRISQYTHALEEWQDPRGTSIPIEYETIFLSLGYDEDKALQLSEHIKIHETVDYKLRSL